MGWRMHDETKHRGFLGQWNIYSCMKPWRFRSVQLLSRVWLFATPWTAACQASLSITNSRRLPKLMSIESVIPSSHLILCHPLLLLPPIPPALGSFPMSQLFTWGAQSIGVSASTSVLPMNIQDWSPLGWTDWISLQYKGLSRVFSNTTVQKHQFLGAQLSSQFNSHIHTWLLEKRLLWLDGPLLHISGKDKNCNCKRYMHPQCSLQHCLQ